MPHTASQAIVVRILPPTNRLGSRIKVIANRGEVMMTWDDRLDPYENAKAAVHKVVMTWDWTGHWIGGALPNKVEASYVFVRYFPSHQSRTLYEVE